MSESKYANPIEKLEVRLCEQLTQRVAFGHILGDALDFLPSKEAHEVTFANSGAVFVCSLGC